MTMAADLVERLLRRAEHPYDFTDVAGLESDLREAAAALSAQPATPAIPDGWMRDREQVVKLAGHLESFGWVQTERGDVECNDQGAAMAAEVVRQVLLPMLATPNPEQPGSSVAQGVAKGFGVSDEELSQLLGGSLKPEEINGPAPKQHDRVRELLHWFARLTRGYANPKWTQRHACELAYYIATSAGNRHIDLNAVRQAAFKEGLNVTPDQRALLVSVGTALDYGYTTPPPAPAAEQGDVRCTDATNCKRCSEDANTPHSGIVAQTQPEARGVGGMVLVPAKMYVEAGAWEAAQFAVGGAGTGEGEAFMDCTLWVGEIAGDDGEKTYGLHVSCDECPEEGSITIAEFAAAPTPSGVRVDGRW